MGDIELSLAMGMNGRTRAILERTIVPEGIKFIINIAHPADIFWRQFQSQEFDVSEMSLSSLMMITSHGNKDWIALPVFPVRHFFHTWSWVNSESGIASPSDLRGKKVGVPEYQMSAALWARGALQHEFGVPPTDIEWYMERTPDRSHGGATGFSPPDGVQINYIPPSDNIGEMIRRGALDATLIYMNDQRWLADILKTSGSASIDRSEIEFDGESSSVRPLFADPIAEGIRYHEATGLYPVNHTVVIRRSVVEKHSWVARAVMEAFEQSKDRYLAAGRDLARAHVVLGQLSKEGAGVCDSDPYPYGIDRNRHVLETMTEYSFEQGLSRRLVKLEELFVNDLLDA